MRLFLAVPAPPAVRDALASWVRAARHRADGWRWVDPALLHVTLRFLGEVDAAQFELLVPAARTVAREAPRHRVAVRGWGVFPGPSRPRVLWAGLAGDLEPLLRLAAGLEQAARSLGHPPEERGFRAHLTLARAARDARPRPPGTPDATAPDFGTIPVDEVILFRSHLAPAGPTYEPLARFALGGAA
ncbi:MAG: RNA 2',3'-cyclic phosphodiesterase [Acidobacteria bacterium]|jgi:2'-5' RNA ligase|nr:RNA 2',3'-cyclic phosphodiesterase [Acidobacteriota bacterium]